MTPFTPRRMTKSFFSHLFAFVIGVSFTSLLMGTNLPAHLVNFNEASVANKTKKLVAAAAAQSWPYQKYFKSKYFSGGCNITGGYRVAFLTLNIGPVASPYANVSRGLQVEYARRHCYDVHVLTRPINGTREPAWEKVIGSLAIMKHFYNYDLIFWNDADTIINNHTIKLEEIWTTATRDNKEKVMVLSGDTLIVNAGQLIWKNNNRTGELLQTLWEMDHLYLYENGPLAAMIGGCIPNNTLAEKKSCYRKVDEGYYNNQFAKKLQVADTKAIYSVVAPWARRDIAWVPKTTMNSYHYDFQPHHFIFHAAGAKPEKKLSLMLDVFSQSLRRNNLTQEYIFELVNTSNW